MLFVSFFSREEFNKGLWYVHKKNTLTFLLYNFERTITLQLVFLDFFKLLKYKNIYNSKIKRY